MAGTVQSPRKAWHGRRKFVDKPLLGFGPAGWILTPIAVALATCWGLGIDLRRKLMWVVCETLGIDAVIWITAQWLPFAWFQLREPVFNPIVLAYILVLCHLSPRRVPWWKYVLLAAWCLVVPLLVVPTARLGNTPGPVGWGLLYMGIADLIGTGAILWLIVGRWQILCVALVGMAVGRASWFVTLNSRELSFGAILLYHASIAGSLVWWGIDSRTARRRAATACPACGYALAGLPAGRDGIQCPECGTSVPLFAPPREPAR